MKAAGTGYIERGRWRSTFVNTAHRHGVALATNCEESVRNGTNGRTLPRPLEPEAGARAKLRNPHDYQVDDAAGKNMLLHSAILRLAEDVIWQSVSEDIVHVVLTMAAQRPGQTVSYQMNRARENYSDFPVIFALRIWDDGRMAPSAMTVPPVRQSHTHSRYVIHRPVMRSFLKSARSAVALVQGKTPALHSGAVASSHVSDSCLRRSAAG